MYTVFWGYRSSSEFSAFAEALAFFIEHVEETPAPRLFGAGYDCDQDEDGFHVVSDGLTDEEREAVELALEVAA